MLRCLPPVFRRHKSRQRLLALEGVRLNYEKISTGTQVPIASATSAPLEPGVLVADKYRIERQLGEGGMGVVFAARHQVLDRHVALKVIRSELADNPAVVERLLLEARSAARLESEHVAKVLDVGTLPSGAPFIVMEYLEGDDLDRLLDLRGPLPEPEAVKCLMQVCEAVAEAHARHIVHRDLKPENIFAARRADGSTTMKVLDFGISKELKPSSARKITQTSASVGSPQYMAPEQMRAEPIDPRADIWALGSILYELLSGHPPFEGTTIPEVCAKVLGQAPPPLSSWTPTVSPGLEAAIHRCLEKSREQRFADVRAFAEAIAPFGGESARLSRQRIDRLAEASGSYTPAAASLAYAATFKPGTSRDVELDALLRHTGGLPASSTLAGDAPRRSPRGVARWAAFGAVAALGLVAGWLLWPAQSGEEPLAASVDAELTTTAGPASSPYPAPPTVAPDSRSSPLPSRDAGSARIAEAEPANELAATSEPAPTDSARASADLPTEEPPAAPVRSTHALVGRRPQAAKAPPTAAPAKAGPAPSTLRPTRNPWDLESFGDRH